MHRPVFELLGWPQSEIRWQMAFDRACDADFRAAWEAEREAQRAAQMTDEQRAAQTLQDLRAVFGGSDVSVVG